MLKLNSDTKDKVYKPTSVLTVQHPWECIKPQSLPFPLTIQLKSCTKSTWTKLQSLTPFPLQDKKKTQNIPQNQEQKTVSTQKLNKQKTEQSQRITT